MSRRDELTESDNTERTPNSGIVEFASKLIFAGTAMIATILVGKAVLGLHDEPVAEVALLNAGVAYYTHEAAGDVVKAMNRIYRKIAKDGDS